MRWPSLSLGGEQSFTNPLAVIDRHLRVIRQLYFGMVEYVGLLIRRSVGFLDEDLPPLISCDVMVGCHLEASKSLEGLSECQWRGAPFLGRAWHLPCEGLGAIGGRGGEVTMSGLSTAG